MNDEKIKEMLNNVMVWVKNNKILTILVLIFVFTLSSCAIQDKDEVVNNKSETQIEQQEVEKEEEEEVEKQQEDEYIEEEKEDVEEQNMTDKTEQAKRYVENLLNDYFTQGTYAVEMSGNSVAVAFGVDIRNCTIDEWNELVEQEKDFCLMIQEYFDKNYEGVNFIVCVSCQGEPYLVVKNGKVYYDYFNGIDKIGFDDDGSYGL